MKNLNRIIIFLFIAIDVYYVWERLSSGNTDRLIIALAVIPVLLGPFLIQKILKYEMGEGLKFVYYLFTFCCVILGSVLNLYNIPETKGFDKVTHFVSGFLTSIVALVFLKKAKIKKPIWFTISYILLFSIAIGGIWEFFEFFCDKITGGDTQHVIDSGINDTMGDMLAATLASLFFCFYYYYQKVFAKIDKIKKLEEYL